MPFHTLGGILSVDAIQIGLQISVSDDCSSTKCLISRETILHALPSEAETIIFNICLYKTYRPVVITF